MPDVHDPEAYLTGAIDILSEYPEEVMKIISEPGSGTKLLSDKPSLRQLRQACDLAYEPILREMQRRRVYEEARCSLPPPRRPRTPEEQARVDAQVARAKVKLESACLPNRPPSGLLAPIRARR